MPQPLAERIEQFEMIARCCAALAEEYGNAAMQLHDVRKRYSTLTDSTAGKKLSPEEMDCLSITQQLQHLTTRCKQFSDTLQSLVDVMRDEMPEPLAACKSFWRGALDLHDRPTDWQKFNAEVRFICEEAASRRNRLMEEVDG